LKSLDISYCPNITEKGVSHYLEYRPELQKFWAAGNSESITDFSLRHLKDACWLQSLNIEFCTKVTDQTFEALASTDPICPLKELYIAGCTGITSNALAMLIPKTGYNLEIADVSNMTQVKFSEQVIIL